MRNDIDPERIANAICMSSFIPGSFLIVEGERDMILFTKFTNHELCNLQPAFGKQNVIDAIEILNKRKIQNTLGIIDNDFNIILGGHKSIPNLLETDFHDLDMSVLISPAFEHLIYLYCQAEKIEKHKFEHGESIVKYFLKTGEPISRLKLANKIFELGLIFKPSSPEGKVPDYGKCYDLNTMKFKGIELLIDLVINYSRNRSANLKSKAQIIEAYQKIEGTVYDAFHLSNGHDIIYLFQFSLRRKLSNHNSNLKSLKELEESLILAYDSRHFSQTILYGQIKKWEKAHNKTVLLF